MPKAVKTLVYRGPAQQVCYELVQHGYPAILVPDERYELPADFSDALLRSNAHFKLAPPQVFTRGPWTDNRLVESATNLGQESH